MSYGLDKERIATLYLPEGDRYYPGIAPGTEGMSAEGCLSYEWRKKNWKSKRLFLYSFGSNHEECNSVALCCLEYMERAFGEGHISAEWNSY
jgi:hypothetical protein